MVFHLQDLKAEMNKLRDGERAKLTKMTIESNGAIKALKSKVEKVRFYWNFIRMSSFHFILMDHFTFCLCHVIHAMHIHLL
jgi:hypothetical protein